MSTKETIIVDQGGKKAVVIQPHDTAIIWSQEIVGVDYTIAGTCHSKVYWTTQGVSHMSTTLDPGFVGNFIFSVCNNTNNPLTLYSGETKIATLVLTLLKQKTKHENNIRSGHITSLNAAGIYPDEETLRMMHREEHHNFSDLKQLVKESDEYKSLKKEEDQRFPKRMQRHLYENNPCLDNCSRCYCDIH